MSNRFFLLLLSLALWAPSPTAAQNEDCPPHDSYLMGTTEFKSTSSKAVRDDIRVSQSDYFDFSSPTLAVDPVNPQFMAVSSHTLTEDHLGSFWFTT